MTLAGYGAFWVVWLLVSIPTIVHLAGRKTETRNLTIFWGVLAVLFPPLGLLFVLALLLKNDIATR
jgi:succinate-acetate transporter protein